MQVNVAKSKFAALEMEYLSFNIAKGLFHKKRRSRFLWISVKYGAF